MFQYNLNFMVRGTTTELQYHVLAHSKKNQSRVTQANKDRSLSIITVVFVLGLK